MLALIAQEDRVVEIRLAEPSAEETAGERNEERQWRENDDQSDRSKHDQPHGDCVSQIHHRESKTMEDRTEHRVLETGQVREKKHRDKKCRDRKGDSNRQTPSRRILVIPAEQGIVDEEPGSAQIAQKEDGQDDALTEILLIGLEKVGGRGDRVVGITLVDRVIECGRGCADRNHRKTSEHKTETEQHNISQL